MNEQQNNLPVRQANQQQAVALNFFDPVQLETMQRVCKMFSKSELVPDMYKESATNPPEKAIANCMIALEIAYRIGASPLMVMQNMTPIYGKPSWSSKFLIATVNSCGRFEPLQYRFTEKGMLGMVDYVEYEKELCTSASGKTYYNKKAVNKQFDGKKIMDIECVAYTTAKGSDKQLESSPVSVRMAVQEGWYGKNGSKWPTMTRQMLMYRAASMWTNTFAPELSMGIKTVEENQDIRDIEFEEIVEPAAEKAANANSVQIGLDIASQGIDKSKTAIVDTETGEIIQQPVPTPAPESAPAPQPEQKPAF